MTQPPSGSGSPGPSGGSSSEQTSSSGAPGSPHPPGPPPGPVGGPGPPGGPPPAAQPPGPPGTPPYAPPPPPARPPEPEPISAAPAQSRGCATAAVAAVAVLVLALAGAGVWAVVTVGSAVGGVYESAPDCSVAPGGVLDGLVPARETELSRRIEGFDQERRDGYECRWATPETAAEVPAAARLVLVRYADRAGATGAQAASDALKAAAKGGSAKDLSGIGDEAKAWNESLQGFDWGCVAVRLSNLYTMTCYTSAVDYQASHSIPGDLALTNAESLARAVVTEIERGDY